MKDYNAPGVTLDDMVFEGRNKAYGAYLLRKIYDNNIIKAMLIATAVFALALVGPQIYAVLKPAEQIVIEEEIPVDLAKLAPPPIDPKTPPPPPMPSTPPPPQVSTIRFVPPEVAPDEEVQEKDPPKQEDLKEVVTSTATVEGDPNANPNELVVEPGTGDGGAVGAPVEEEIFTVVEVAAQFPGGEGEMMKFFQKNVKYPYAAQKAEIQGRVYVELIVTSVGKITEVKIARGLGFGLDEEAMRVVRMMPDFTPAKQTGRAVKQKLIIPFKFTLQ